MNVKTISLALASLAVMTTVAANAQSIYANVGSVGAGATVVPVGAANRVLFTSPSVGQCNVLTAPAVIAQPAVIAAPVMQWPEVRNAVGTSCVLSYPRSYTGANYFRGWY